MLGLHVILLQSAEHFTKPSCHVLIARQIASAWPWLTLLISPGHGTSSSRSWDGSFKTI